MKFLILLTLLVGCASSPETLEVRCFKNKKMLYKEIVSNISFVSQLNYKDEKYKVCIVKDIRNE